MSKFYHHRLLLLHEIPFENPMGFHPPKRPPPKGYGIRGP